MIASVPMATAPRFRIFELLVEPLLPYFADRGTAVAYAQVGLGCIFGCSGVVALNYVSARRARKLNREKSTPRQS